MLFWKGEYVNILPNILQHTETSNTKLLILKKLINCIASLTVSIPSKTF